MSDALLKAVLANPDDDLPRLVYADWLDENGDSARAEFIRTQIELAKLPDHDPRYRHLEDREHELMSEHEAGWLGGESPRLSEWEWRRGFVDEIAGDSWQLTQIGPHLISANPLVGVRSIGPRFNQAVRPLDWRTAGWVPGVRKLAVSNADFGSDPLAEFLNATDPPHLHSLDFSNNPGLDDVCELFRFNALRSRLRAFRVGGGRQQSQADGRLDPRDLSELLDHAPLDTLTCFDAEITSHGLRTLLSAPFAGTLKHLDISDNPIAPDAYRAFQQCHPAMRLDKLDVSGTPLAGISLEPLLNARSLESLTKLEMNGCGSARRNMEVLSRSAFWHQATELRAHSGTIPASTLEPLCDTAGPPGLRLLDLADNYLRTDGVGMLCEAPWAGSLTWLALSRNYLDNHSCEVLARSGRFTQLRTLHLAHNNLGQEGSEGEAIHDSGVEALAFDPSLANLRLLTLSYTEITDSAVEGVLNSPYWRLFGLGIGGCNLSPAAARTLGNSPRLKRFLWLDVSDNPRLRGQALRPLAESPYLSRMCELDCGGIDIDDDVRAIFRERLGPRFSH
jgi:uncharacterized protein (TIGR02996 family)